MTINFRDGLCLRSAPVFGASTMLGGSALAKAPKLGTQTPYWHRMMLGEAEVTIVSDGTLPLGPPKGTFVGVPDDEVKKMLTDNFLNPENVVLEQNSPIVNTGDKLILFDTGMGTSKAFGPTTGRQQKSMAEAGIKPGDIDAVVLSHAHIDHIGGIVGADDKPLFPNAQYYITQSDFDFWIDEGNKLSGCVEGLRGTRPQESAAGARPHRLHQGWPGIPARRAGDRGARAYRRPHHLHGDARPANPSSSSAISRTTPCCCWRSRGWSSPSTPIRSKPPRRA